MGVRIAVGLGVAVLALWAGVVRGPSADGLKPGRTEVEGVRLGNGGGTPAPGSRVTVSEERVTFHEGVSEAAPSAPPRGGNALPEAASGLAVLLRRELGLDPAQAGRLEDILREREDRIAAYHQEIRSSGVFNPRDYDRRTWDLRFESYRRIEALLDSAQRARFQVLASQGRLNDPVAFELDESLVVLDPSFQR